MLQCNALFLVRLETSGLTPTTLIVIYYATIQNVVELERRDYSEGASVKPARRLVLPSLYSIWRQEIIHKRFWLRYTCINSN